MIERGNIIAKILLPQCSNLVNLNLRAAQDYLISLPVNEMYGNNSKIETLLKKKIKNIFSSHKQHTRTQDTFDKASRNMLLGAGTDIHAEKSSQTE